MIILILNWRDIKNPSSGGAEVLTHEMAKRWVIAGNRVIQRSASFPSAKEREVIDGVEFIRKGSWWNVHIIAFYYYLRYLQKQTDIVVDEVHWFPFFSILYAPKKTVALVCEVADKLFYNIFPYPIALWWRLIEKFYLYLYRNTPAMVISQSTRNDLIKEGHTSSNIIVLPMGLSVPSKIKQFPKEKNPTLISVARLNKQKGIFDILTAFGSLHKEISSAVLWIVGSGAPEILEQLKNILAEEKLTKSVKFFGFVDESKKFELYTKAHLLISASVQEGWGLTVPEAGITKTPAVVYNTNGFCDIIEQNKSGLLVEHTPEALKDGVIAVLQNKKKYRQMQQAIYTKAKQYTWENTASVSLKFLKQHSKPSTNA
jgi:glycosyltransferase involved in cell wall biosynthesis